MKKFWPREGGVPRAPPRSDNASLDSFRRYTTRPRSGSRSSHSQQLKRVYHITFQIYSHKISDFLPEFGNTTENVSLRVRIVGHDIYSHHCESRLRKKQRFVDTGPVRLEQRF